MLRPFHANTAPGSRDLLARFARLLQHHARREGRHAFVRAAGRLGPEAPAAVDAASPRG